MHDDAAVAQSVEQRTENPRVISSILIGGMSGSPRDWTAFFFVHQLPDVPTYVPGARWRAKMPSLNAEEIAFCSRVTAHTAGRELLRVVVCPCRAPAQRDKLLKYA